MKNLWWCAGVILLVVPFYSSPVFSQTLGSQTIYSTGDYDPASNPNAFPITASASLQAQYLSIYVDTGTTANGLTVGIYSSNSSSSHPNQLLASGSLSGLKSGNWMEAKLNTAIAIAGGTKYWIAITASGGNIAFRRDTSTNCKNETYPSSQSTLPTTWSPGPQWNGCPLSAFASASSTSGGGTTPPPPPPPGGAGWILTFSDEFDGNTLDTSQWNVDYPPNHRNAFPTQWTNDSGEIECMMPDDVLVSGGIAQLKGERRSVNCPDGQVHNYTSGVIAAWDKFSQLYGYFEARVKVAAGAGLWPAFWMVPANGAWPPEIDVFELLGNNPNTVYMNLHWLTNGTHNSDSSTYGGPNFSTGYHTFAVDWEPGSIVWYVDGNQVKVETGSRVPNVPFYPIVQQAIGGWPGNPTGSTPFPAVVGIDYVRVYRKVNSGACYSSIPGSNTIPKKTCP